MTILQLGSTLRDTYEVERYLGEGAFAEVYRVKHRFLGRQALKVFKRVGMSMADIHEMLGEAILLSWRSFGADLVPLSTALDLTKQICRGLVVAHGEKPPIIHRDIKPQNILIGYEAEGLRARISDFGLAKSVNPLTLLATTAGTMAFKPPEALSEQKGDSCASDAWAIGATLYMLLTDRLPTSSAGGQPATRTSPVFVPPSRINPNATAALDTVLEKALRPHSRERYQNASEMLEAVEAAETAPTSRVVDKRSESAASKEALGPYSENEGQNGKELADKALGLGRVGRLAEAADLMEEAFNTSPSLRGTYAERVSLWRRGISM